MPLSRTADARKHHGFSLIELLVVIVIISLLIGLLLPALGSARTTANRVHCLSNQRQMMIATTLYTDAHRGYFMPALFTDFAADPARRIGWDFIEVYGPSGLAILPGAMWDGTDAGRVLQCPSMDGPDNWTSSSLGPGVSPYTGYNYNTSYIGGPTMGVDPSYPSGDGPRWGVDGSRIAASARRDEIGDPSWTAVFGDGAFGQGANKFMRAPWRGDRDSDVGRSAHGAGAQAFLHGGVSNAAHADGHAAGFSTMHRATYAEAMDFLAAGAGFLSEGNGVYDLSVSR